MPDKPKSGSPPAPSFYSAAAGMKPGGPGGDAAGGPGGAGTPAGQSGEKVKNVKVLLEVYDKMEKQEEDPEAKAMIQQMADLAKQYMTKLEGGAGAKKGPAGMPATGEAGSGGGMGSTTGAGGGAPDMTGGVGAPAA
jgi:hypothetical protein